MGAWGRGTRGYQAGEAGKTPPLALGPSTFDFYPGKGGPGMPAAICAVPARTWLHRTWGPPRPAGGARSWVLLL